MQIRNYRSQDLEELLRIGKEVHSSASAWSELSQWLQTKQVLVAEEAGIVLGFLIYQSAGGVLEVLALAVSSCFRQRGVGGSLLKNMLNKINNLGRSEEVWLEVHEENQVARTFYLNHGFLEVGKRPSYYSDGKSAVLMSFRL
jgi:ribosomal-protein-alanine N-acetyltransferase